MTVFVSPRGSRRLRRACTGLTGVAVTTLLVGSPAWTSVASAAPLALVVTSAADSGPGTLREAIENANANAGLDTITFSLPGSPGVISLTSALPTVTDPLLLDGGISPDCAGGPGVLLDGSAAGSSDGLTVTAGSRWLV